jgi:flagellar basal-body rod protein FlgF
MPGGAYIALSGLQTRFDQLDRLASDLANATTAGYKGERATTVPAERPAFDALLDAAIDVTEGPRRVDFTPGTITTTGRDLDVALDGPGFFAVEAPGGVRYTRNGHFNRSADGRLVTNDGYAVLGENGPITLPDAGAIAIDADGTVRSGAAAVGKLRTVTFDDLSSLKREGASLFAAPDGVDATPIAQPTVRSGALESSNVSVVDRMARIVEVTRAFEGLQRGLGLLMNDINARAISELGRR